MASRPYGYYLNSCYTPGTLFRHPEGYTDPLHSSQYDSYRVCIKSEGTPLGLTESDSRVTFLRDYVRFNVLTATSGQ